MKKKKILFLTNHIAFFVSHRLNIFYEAKRKSYDFLLISGRQSSFKMEKIAIKKIKKLKLKYKILNFNSYEFNLLNDIMSIINLYKIINKYKPDIVHTVAPKPNLYGGLISLFIKIDKTIMSISGLGFLFTSNLNIKDYFKKIIYLFLLKFIFSNQRLQIIVQNKNDYKFISKRFNFLNRLKLIKGGSGVEIKKFQNLKKIKNCKNVVFAGRLVINKGIKEFIDAAKLLKKEFPDWNFVIYGTNDYISHDRFDIRIYKNELKNKTIIYKGYKNNIIKILENTSIFCLPSYREGMPKSVLEAGAAGVPSIVTDSPGCKESVINNVTGLIAKRKNKEDLALKIKYLILNPKLRRKMSYNAKKFVKKEASIKKVTEDIFSLYA